MTYPAADVKFYRKICAGSSPRIWFWVPHLPEWEAPVFWKRCPGGRWKNMRQACATFSNDAGLSPC